jgi:hypothetical protein
LATVFCLPALSFSASSAGLPAGVPLPHHANTEHAQSIENFRGAAVLANDDPCQICPTFCPDIASAPHRAKVPSRLDWPRCRDAEKRQARRQPRSTPATPCEAALAPPPRGSGLAGRRDRTGWTDIPHLHTPARRVYTLFVPHQPSLCAPSDVSSCNATSHWAGRHSNHAPGRPGSGQRAGSVLTSEPGNGTVDRLVMAQWLPNVAPELPIAPQPILGREA